MEQGDDPYEILGVTKDASKEAIRKAYRNLAFKHHPDKQMTSEETANTNQLFAKISAAYEIMTNPVLKYDYDQSVQENGRGFFGRATYGYHTEDYDFSAPNNSSSSDEDDDDDSLGDYCDYDETEWTYGENDDFDNSEYSYGETEYTENSDDDDNYAHDTTTVGRFKGGANRGCGNIGEHNVYNDNAGDAVGNYVGGGGNNNSGYANKGNNGKFNPQKKKGMKKKKKKKRKIPKKKKKNSKMKRPCMHFSDPYEVFTFWFEDEFGVPYPGKQYDNVAEKEEDPKETSKQNKNGKNTAGSSNNRTSDSLVTNDVYGEKSLSVYTRPPKGNNRPLAMHENKYTIDHPDGSVETISEFTIKRPDGSTETLRITDKANSNSGNWNRPKKKAIEPDEEESEDEESSDESSSDEEEQHNRKKKNKQVQQQQEQDFSNMKVRELKQILADRGVDTSQFLDKDDFIRKIRETNPSNMLPPSSSPPPPRKQQPKPKPKPKQQQQQKQLTSYAEAELSNMKIKELKQILSDRGVDSSALIERREFVQKIQETDNNNTTKRVRIKAQEEEPKPRYALLTNEEFASYKVKDLKRVLSTRGIDSSGLIEKSELIEKIKETEIKDDDEGGAVVVPSTSHTNNVPPPPRRALQNSTNSNNKNMSVRDMKKILSERNVDYSGLVEKDEFVRKVNETNPTTAITPQPPQPTTTTPRKSLPPPTTSNPSDMKIRDLKKILSERNIDFSNLVEKEEFVQKVKETETPTTTVTTPRKSCPPTAATSNMKIKDLKKILSERNIDFSGMVEKEEFIQKVQETDDIAAADGDNNPYEDIHMDDTESVSSMSASTLREDNNAYSTLSIKELKSILTGRGVDCSGFVERSEFVEKMKETQPTA